MMKRGIVAIFVLVLAGVAPGLSQTPIPNEAIVHAASFRPGPLAPELIFSIFLADMTDRTESAMTLPLPTELAGVSIRITDGSGTTRPCSFFFASPTQVNALIPAGTALGPATLTLIRSDGSEAAGKIVIEAVSPGIFTANGSGQGVPAALAVHVPQEGELTREFTFEMDAETGSFVPAPLDLGPRGEQVILELFGTGLRGANQADVRVFVNGRVAQVLGLAAQGQFDGLDQVNVAVPREVIGHGRVDILLMIGERQTNLFQIEVSDANKPELTFLTQYQLFWEGEEVATAEPVGGDFDSGVIALPEGEGERLFSVRVGLEEFTDRTTDEEVIQPDPTLLDNLTLEVELFAADGSVQAAPVVIAENALQSVIMNVPEEFIAFRFRVSSASPSLTYYVHAFVDLRRNTAERLDRLIADLEAIGGEAATTAVGQTRDAKQAFEEGLESVRKAERDAKAAKEAFDEFDIDEARRLLDSARQGLEDGVSSVMTAKQALQEALDALAGVGGGAGAAARFVLNQIRKLLCVLPSILRMHYFIYENVFYDIPEITINPGAATTGYNRTTMKISVEDGLLEAPSVLKHEYGHAAFFKKTGLLDLANPGQHNPSQPGNAEGAWKEGVATFLAQACLKDPVYFDPVFMFRQDLENRRQGVPNPTDNVTANGSNVEANVQAALWDMFDGGSNGVADGDNDGFSIPFSEIWRAICAKPRTFDEFLTKLRERLTDDQKTALDAMLPMNGITP